MTPYPDYGSDMVCKALAILALAVLLLPTFISSCSIIIRLIKEHNRTKGKSN